MTYQFFNNMELELIVRCLLACICGALIGLERTKNQKAAGIRTYIIVAVGAALFTIISKYGFLDAIGNGARVDVSRVACNIVTGVGFLGAGIIYVKGNQILGLVTSAGIWVMAAIGMAIGAGMYVVAVIATVLVFAVQVVMDMLEKGRFANSVFGTLVVQMNDEEKTLAKLEEVLFKSNIEIVNTQIKKNKDSVLTYTFSVKMPEMIDTKDVVEEISNIKSVRSIDF